MMEASQKPWISRYDPGVPQELNIPDMPLFAFLDEAARKYPDRACTLYEGQRISYAEMGALTDRLAAGLVQLGVQKGDRVGILLPNSPQFVLAYYAALKAGAAVAAINPAFKAREVEHQIQDSGVTILFTPASALSMLDGLRQRSGLRQCVVFEDGDAHRLVEFLQPAQEPVRISDPPTVEELIRAQPPGAASPVPVSGEDAAIFQYSGGTTGTPKAAVGLHRNLVANTLQFRAWLAGLEEGREAVMLAIPLYHVYGMVVGMSVGVHLAASLVLEPDPRNLTRLLSRIQEHRCSFFPGVPAMYAAVNRFPDVQAGKYDLRSIRACISGSAPLLKEIRETFEGLTGAQLMEGYGLSEAPTATHCNPMMGEKRSGSIGLPLPGVDCRIVDLKDRQRTVAVGEAGELLIRGPQVMWGYHARPDETALVLEDGWLHTGDIARMDADGYFYIVDRIKDLIKVSGFQVWPREIEEVLTSHPAVQEAAAVGVADARRGEVVKAWVVPVPGMDVSEAELIAYCADQMVYYKVPAQVEFTDSLPRSGVGKLLRRVLREQSR